MIHLEPGAGTQTDYSVTFNREEGENLHIAFINYYSSEDGRSTTPKSTRPEIVVL
jgi:hypothetical protein